MREMLDRLTVKSWPGIREIRNLYVHLSTDEGEGLADPYLAAQWQR